MASLQRPNQQLDPPVQSLLWLQMAEMQIPLAQTWPGRPQGELAEHCTRAAHVRLTQRSLRQQSSSVLHAMLPRQMRSLAQW